MSGPPNLKRSCAPRFSLLTAILLMTIIGLVIVTVRLWREVGPLREETRRLRDEVGELSIEDDAKIHAIEVRTKDPLTWKFRVWVPKGQKVKVRSRWGDVPRTGVPEAKAGVDLDEGEHWVTYRVQHSPNENSWGVILESVDSGTGQEIPEKERWWQWPEPAAIWGEGVQHMTGTFDEDQEPFILKRWRVANTDDSDDFKKMEITAGFIIWLEQK